MRRLSPRPFHVSWLCLLMGCAPAHAEPVDGTTQQIADASQVKSSSGAPIIVEQTKMAGSPANATSPQWAAKLDALGIYPSVLLQENMFDSGTLGVSPGKVELISSYSLGLDLDLSKLADITGGAFHFAMVRNYGRINNQVGSTMGAFPLAQIPQNAPKRDVPIFTYEQHLLHDHLDIEVGRKNIVWFFLDDFSQWENFSRLSNLTWLTLPPPYATWSARARYDFRGGYYLQGGVWEYNTTLWGKDGWDWRTSGSTGATFLGSAGFHTSFHNDRYPAHYELTAYVIDAPQSDPYYTTRGTSVVFDSTSAAQTHRGGTGLILSGGKVFYRIDGPTGQRSDDPSSLYAYGGVGWNLQSWAAAGVTADAFAGVAWLNPWQLTGDIIGIKGEYNRLTSREQMYLSDANRYARGAGYESGRTSLFVQAYAHFMVTKFASVDPFVAYGTGANTLFDPYATKRPHNGYVLGAIVTFNIGNLAGLPAPKF